VAEDGVEAFTEEEHLSGLEYIKRMYGAEIKKILGNCRNFQAEWSKSKIEWRYMIVI
jgi:hemerythrin-like domain-containing protein